MTFAHPCTDCQPLKLPYMDPEDLADPVKLQENFKELERYSNYVIKNCLCCDCGGGG